MSSVGCAITPACAGGHYATNRRGVRAFDSQVHFVRSRESHIGALEPSRLEISPTLRIQQNWQPDLSGGLWSRKSYERRIQ